MHIKIKQISLVVYNIPYSDKLILYHKNIRIYFTNLYGKTLKDLLRTAIFALDVMFSSPPLDATQE